MILLSGKARTILCAIGLFAGVAFNQDSSGVYQSSGSPSVGDTARMQDGEHAEPFKPTPHPVDEAQTPSPTAAKEARADIGYAAIPQTDLTGAVSVINGDEISNSPGFSIESALQGRAAGVAVTQNSGQPNSGFMFQIRGLGSFNYSDPLYVVDGIPMRDITYLNPNDVERISILKDASAAAMYGMRGMGGVVLITTKEAKDVVPQGGFFNIQYKGYYGNASPWKAPDLCNAEEWKQLKIESIKNNGGDTTGLGQVQAIDGSKSTDWWKAVTRNDAAVQRHCVSIAAANNLLQLYLSGMYSGQEGIIIKSDARKFSFHANGQINFFDRAKVGINVTANSIQTHPIAEGDVITNVFNATPASPVRAGVKDTLAPDRFNNRLNPVGIIENNFIDTKQKKLIYSLYAETKIANMITIATDFGFDCANLDYSLFIPKFFISSQSGNNAGSSTVKRLNQTDISVVFANSIAFNKTFGESHTVSLYAGITTQDDSTEYFSASNTNTPGNTPSVRYLQATTSTSPQVEGSATANSLFSFWGRFNYDYASRYFIALSIRRDGSSRFGPDNKWGNFPSASIAWKISEERFMKGLSFISLLKFRGGYGIVGNQDLGDRTYLAYAIPGQNYVLGTPQQLVPSTIFIHNGNPDLTWEEQKSTNIGLDLSLFKGKIEFSGDWYTKTTSDALMLSPISALYGYGETAWTNGGEIQNTGFDFSAGYRENIGKLSSRLWGIISTYKNKVIKLGNNSGDDAYLSSGTFGGRLVTRTAVDHPAGLFYGYKTNGLFQSQTEIDAFVDKKGNKIQPNAKPGDVRYVDANGDGQWDQDYIGNPHPKFTYGFGWDLSHEGRYGGFDLRLFLQGSYGNEIFNATRTFTNTSTSYFNQERRMLNHWTATNPTNDASLPRMNSKDADNSDKISDIYVEDGSYMRVKEVQIGYALPKKWLLNRTVRLYVGAQNLFTFTKYTGLDPEIGIGNDQTPLDIGIDMGAYPQALLLFSGINVSL
jgi:TonB-linked SusC/RagA family outer membrane protein